MPRPSAREAAGSVTAPGYTSRRGMDSCQSRRKNGSPSRSTSSSTRRSKLDASLVCRERARISVVERLLVPAIDDVGRQAGVRRVGVAGRQPQRLGRIQATAVLEQVLAAVVDRDRDRARRSRPPRSCQIGRIRLALGADVEQLRRAGLERRDRHVARTAGRRHRSGRISRDGVARPCHNSNVGGARATAR